MSNRFASYLIINLKYDTLPMLTLEPFAVQTMDVSEQIKRMFNHDGEQAIGNTYRIPRDRLLASFADDAPFASLRVHDGDTTHEVDILDSYLYVFHTRIAFLCLGISFSEMAALSAICHPGFAESRCEFSWCDTAGNAHPFSMEGWLEELGASWGFEKLFSGDSSMLLESYAYILSLHDTVFPDLEHLRHTTFCLHQMRDPASPQEDDSEADIRYVYAVRNTALGGYRWGCCVTSQTIAYAVADPTGATTIQQEMTTQAEDGLPLVLLALYQKYTCLRFTELIANAKNRRLKSLLELKKMMLSFQAYGSVTPANLSRWHNVKQIYAYLLEVNDTRTAFKDIRGKIDILTEHQQEIEKERSSRIVNLITIFGVVGIMSSVQSIVQILSDGSNLMWSVTALTLALMALCFGLAMKK